MEISLADHIRKTAPHKRFDADLGRFAEVFTLGRRDHFDEYSHRSLIFVERGLVRLYSMRGLDEERTEQFGVPGCWIGGWQGLGATRPMRAQAVEASRIVLVRPQAYQNLMSARPDLEPYFLNIFRRGAMMAQRRGQLLTTPGEERYRLFQRRYRDFVQRVPQYMLASFLGLTPEWLSKIRGMPEKAG